jgi:acetoacetyl-CoA synthetase
MRSEILWTPKPELVENSHLKSLELFLKESRDLEFNDYEDLWKWSCSEVSEFWLSIWEYFDIQYDGEIVEVLSGEEMPFYSWFGGTKLNYAEHIFRNANINHPAVRFLSEDAGMTEISWQHLTSEVVRIKHYLMENGIEKGDRVVGFLPNTPETLIAFLAVNSIGAIWSCCSPDFGVDTVIDRFEQIEPKCFIACESYQYNGKDRSRLEEISNIRSSLSSIELFILIPTEGKKLSLDQATNWFEIPEVDAELQFERVPFDHPIWVLYSSGTTGKPKAITHSHGGILLEHLKYIHFHNDVHAGENFFWYTTTGWMMWNFLIGSLLSGATAVLYDGSPSYPDLDILWKNAALLPIHHFGTSAPFLTARMKKELYPKNYGLSKLRSIGSTGAPLPPEVFEWVYEKVSPDVWLCSMSGGTDVCTAFVGGIPGQPVHKGYIQGRALGCSLNAINESGESVFNSLGEMVIDVPMPSMPIYFWNDIDNSKYKSSYFEKFPGKWCHGDWIELDRNGHLKILGRSDATLNRKGIRIGTAEIYAALDEIDGLKDSLIINIELPDGGDFMPLFIVVEAGTQIEAISDEIKSNLKTKCSPRHIPDTIIQVPDIPYTLSGKKMEVPVKQLFMGQTSLINKESIRNPEAIDYFQDHTGEILATIGK